MPTIVPQCISVRLHLSKMFRSLIFRGSKHFFVHTNINKPWSWGLGEKAKFTLTLMWKNVYNLNADSSGFLSFFIPSKNSCYLKKIILYDLFVEGVVQTIFVSVATLVFAMLE